MLLWLWLKFMSNAQVVDINYDQTMGMWKQETFFLTLVQYY